MTSSQLPPGGDPTAREKCTATAKRSGKRCTHWPMHGSTVCAQHGGKAPQVMAAARRRLQEQAAREAAATLGVPREIAPAAALLEEVHRTAGHVAWLGEVVAGLERREVVWGLAEEIDRPLGEDGGGGVETKHKAGVNVWVDLYQRERKHLVWASKEAIAAGVNERIVKVVEQQGALLAGVISRILDALELTAEQRLRVPEVVPRELRAVAGGEIR